MPEEMNHRCLFCTYIYDPSYGDPEIGIPKNTPFEDLPEDWICPECGSAKTDFVPMAKL